MTRAKSSTDRPQSPRDFGKLLQELRVSRGVSQEELATRLTLATDAIAAWEFGAMLPDRATIVNDLPQVLRLTDTTLDGLLKLAGYAPLQPDEVSATYQFYRSGDGGVFATDYNPRRQEILWATSWPPAMQEVSESTGISELRTRLQDLESSMEAMRDEVEKAPLPAPQGETLAIREKLDYLEQTVSGVLAASQRISAPVILPPTEDLQVRLVAATSLVRLEEYRQEENKWFAVTGMFLGGILGMFVNWVTGGVMTPASWVLVVAFLVIAALAGYTSWQYHLRAAPLWKRILGEGAPIPQDETRPDKTDRVLSEAEGP